MSKYALFMGSLAGGGMERSMLNIAGGVMAGGHDVDLLLNVAEGPYLKDLPKGMRVLEFGRRRRLGLRFTHVVTSLASYMRREEPDAIYSALGPQNVQLLLASRMSGSRCPCIISVRKTFSVEGQRGSLYRRAHHLAYGVLYPSAHAIIAVSKGVKRYLIENFGIPDSLISVVYNPVFSEDIVGRSLEPVDDPWLNGSQRPVLVAAGRFCHEKGFHLLIEALQFVVKERQVRLILLGDGELRGPLTEQVERLGLSANVAMPGFVDNPFAYMSRADLFVAPSLREAFGNVLVEALACGCPVVSTDCPYGPREILEDGRWGTLVPTGDAGALARAILGSLDRNVDRKSLVERARYFSIQKAVDAYLSLSR